MPSPARKLLVNATDQPVEVHLADRVVLALGPRERVETELGAGPHPQLDELASRLIVSVIPIQSPDDEDEDVKDTSKSEARADTGRREASAKADARDKDSEEPTSEGA
jgi:hypothetical protein